MNSWPLRKEKLIVTILLIVASIFSFMGVNAMNAELAESGRPFTQLHSVVDTWIPFIPAFAFFYYLYYIWVLLAVPVTDTRERFRHAAFAFGFLQTAAVLTFLVFPSYMVRPDVLGSGMAENLVRAMYRVDPGFNLLPSLHVGHTVLVALLYREYRPKYFPVVALGTTMICLSTVLIKQHYIIDIPFGILYALGAYRVAAPVTRRLQELAEQRA